MTCVISPPVCRLVKNPSERLDIVLNIVFLRSYVTLAATEALTAPENRFTPSEIMRTPIMSSTIFSTSLAVEPGLPRTSSYRS